MKIPEAVKSDIALAAHGNMAAARFMSAYWRISQVFDDLLDRDKEVSKDEAMAALVDWTTTLAVNPFWHANRELLLGQLVTAAIGSLDGDDWERSEHLEQRKLSPAVRCTEDNLMVLVAWLCRDGDTQATREVTPRLRTFDLDLKRKG